jgi:hypothetical protein
MIESAEAVAKTEVHWPPPKFGRLNEGYPRVQPF